MRKDIVLVAAALLGSAGLCQGVALQPVLYSSIAGMPSADEPGGGTFLAGTSSPFNRFVSSPGGNYWALIARRTGGVSGNYAVIRGSGDAVGDTVLAATGDAVPAPFGTLTFLTGTTGTTRGLNLTELAVHDSGAVAFSGQTSGVPKQVLCVYSPSGNRVERRGGELLPGLLVTPGGSVSTNAAIIDSSNTASFLGINFLDSTRTTFQTFSITNLTAPVNFAAYGRGAMGATLAAADLINQQAVTPITGGAGTLNGHVGGSLGMLPDGSSWVLRGTETTSTTTPQIIRDGVVTYEFASPIPGLPGEVIASTSGGIGTPVLDANNNLYVPVQSLGGVRGLLRNDSLIAKGGAPIFPGSSSSYVTDRAFLALAAPNGRHAVLNYIQTTPTLIRVCVVDGQTLVAQTGDHVDVNLNGLDDDGYEIKDLDPSSSSFSADGYLYLGVTLQQTGQTATVGGAMLRIAAPSAVCHPEWQLAGSGVSGSGVNTLSVFPNGDVAAGGDFSGPGSNVARYSPSANTWSALGAGTNGVVYCSLVHISGDLIVGGSFSEAGGVPTMNVARYNPVSGVWSPLGTSIGGGGVNGPVYAMAELPNGGIAVGGTFNLADGLSAVSNVAIYSDVFNSWSPSASLGAGTDGTVYALAALESGDFIAGGSFSNAGGGSASNIARFTSSSSAWSPLGTGVDAQVLALEKLAANDVAVGGSFLNANGLPASHIARVDPSSSTWSALGAGADDDVACIRRELGTGVFVGGSFLNAGGAPAARIARFDIASSVWSALDSGADQQVRAIASLSGALAPEHIVAGGTFSNVGGYLANRIAIWREHTAPSINNQPVSINCLGAPTLSYEVDEDGIPAPFFQWQWKAPGATDWSAMVNGPLQVGGSGSATVSGVRTNRIDILPNGSIEYLRGSQFRVVLTNSCGSVTSDPAKLAPCSADFDCNGTVSVNDLFAFLAAWFAQNGLTAPGLSADFDSNGTVSVNDLFAFLAAWFAQNGACS